MAVNLLATARLNAAPYLRGIKSIKSATESLATTGVAGAHKVEAAEQSRWDKNKLGAKGAIAEAAALNAAQGKAAKMQTRLATSQAEAAKIAKAATASAISQAANLTPIQQRVISDNLKARAAYQSLENAIAKYGAASAQALRATDANTRAQKNLHSSLRAANAERVAATAATERLGSVSTATAHSAARAASGLAAQRYLYADLARSLATSSLLAAALPVATLVTAASWEKKFADVKRTIDPQFSASKVRVDALRDSLIAMTQAMPVSFGDVTAIATLANQMGIATEQVGEFTRAVAMFSATSGVSVDIAATAFGRLQSVLGDASIPFMDMADAILKVGVNSVSTEDEIINVTTQISSIAAQAGFSAKEMIGLSGALASVRVPPELSRGLITRVFGQIDKAVAKGGTGLETLARISGTTAEEFRNNWGKEGAANLFNNFLHGLRDAGAGARGELESLGITSVRDVPVMLRLANAADAKGQVGELLTQTLNDANKAAGETQRQYTIMTDTVAGRMKILGNNILAFFDAMGKGALGPLGKLIDGLSTNIRNFTRDLDKPIKLLNQFEIPFITNGAAFETGLIVAGLASAFLLAGSAVLKFMQVGVGLKQMFQVFAGFGGAAKGVAAVGAEAGLAARGVQALGRAGLGLGRFFMGPWGIALFAGSMALSALSDWMNRSETSADSLAESLAKVNTIDFNELDSALSKIDIGAYTKGIFDWSDGSHPFAGGVNDLREALDLIQNVDKTADTVASVGFRGIRNPDAKATSFGKSINKSLTSGIAPATAGIKKIDESFQKMIDAGNGARVAGIIQEIARNGKDLDTFFKNGGDNAKAFVDNLFDTAGVEKTKANYDKFARGTLPAVTAALYESIGATEEAVAAFEGDTEALGKFSATLDDAAASFISFGDAMEAATKRNKDGGFESVDLKKWGEGLAAQMKAQAAFEDNLSFLGKNASAGLIEELAKLGPAGADQIQALADGIRAGSPDAIAALQEMEAGVEAQAAKWGNRQAEETGMWGWIESSLKDVNLSQTLKDKLTAEQGMDLQAAGKGLGADVVTGILTSLAEGKISYAEALHQLTVGQPPITPEIDFSSKDNEAAAKRSFDALSSKLMGGKITLTPAIDAKTTVADLRKIVDDPKLNKIDIDANLTLTEAYAQSREFQVWAASTGVDMYLGANPAAAYLTTNGVKAYAESQTVRMQLDAVGAPAEGKIWDVVQRADGTTAFIELNADGTAAEDARVRVVDKVGNTVATMKLSANDASVYNTVKQWSGRVVGTSYINIVGQYSEVHGGGRGAKHANGGFYDAYANGGIRSKHKAQIAPPGANRLWAEPETEGEAYIPFARSKRTRSLGILDAVANKFGYSLVSKSENTRRYADGGYFEAQKFARYTRMMGASVNGTDVAATQRNLSFTFVNPVTRDPLTDAWNKMQEFGDL